MKRFVLIILMASPLILGLIIGLVLVFIPTGKKSIEDLYHCASPHNTCLDVYSTQQEVTVRGFPFKSYDVTGLGYSQKGQAQHRESIVDFILGFTVGAALLGYRREGHTSILGKLIAKSQP